MLLSVDEATYRGGTMGPDHPIAWCHEYDGGRSFSTALGHAEEAYQDPAFLRHLLGALRRLGVVDDSTDDPVGDAADGATGSGA